MKKRKTLNFNKKNDKGITLITLVITIIVLIILATISIGTLGGENGIIKRTKYAKERTEIAQEIDILKICTALAMGEDPQGNVTEVNLRKELDKNVKNYKLEAKTNKFKVTFESGRSYIVYTNGNVTENADSWDDTDVINPKVIFNYNGATSGNIEKEKQLTYGSTYGTLPSPSKTATVTYEYNGATGGNEKGVETSEFTFGGWYKENTFENQVTESTQVTEQSNHTLYAKWTGGEITLPTPTKTGYTFECWCTDTELSNSVGAGGATYTPTSNITLYAKWTQNPIITYTVTYNQNTTDTVGNMPSSQIKTQGTELILSTNVPTREGYNFLGWSTSTNGEVEYLSGGTLNIDSNLTLYAVWKINIIVSNTQPSYTLPGGSSYEYCSSYKTEIDWTCKDTQADPCNYPEEEEQGYACHWAVRWYIDGKFDHEESVCEDCGVTLCTRWEGKSREVCASYSQSWDDGERTINFNLNNKVETNKLKLVWSGDSNVRIGNISIVNASNNQYSFALYNSSSSSRKGTLTLKYVNGSEETTINTWTINR